MATEYAYIGEELKYAVTLSALGFSMERDDFRIVISCGKGSVEFSKSDLLFDGEEQWYIAIDTSVFKKPGDMFATVYAYVPDDDYPDGFRTEIDKQKLITLKAL